MKFLIMILGIIMPSMSYSKDNFVTGGSLYLIRGGLETHRAEFNYSQDCELIAKAMNDKEPNVKWFCSTYQKPTELNCNLKGVTIINTDMHTKEKLDLDFKISMTRGKATTTLSSAISSFDYTESKKLIKLTNNYLYISDNYLSEAVNYIIIDSETLKSKVINSDLQENGSGYCAASK